MPRSSREDGQVHRGTTKSGNFECAAGLQPVLVALRSGKISVIDRPFVKTKEIVGGYTIMEAKSRDEALALARRFVELHLKHWPTFEGECEVRPLEEEAQPAT